MPQGIICDKKNINKYFTELKTNVINKSTRVSSPNMVGHMVYFNNYLYKKKK